jgi:hypothetical protein
VETDEHCHERCANIKINRGIFALMATVTFDTLKFANRLKAAGVPEKQAERV